MNLVGLCLCLNLKSSVECEAMDQNQSKFREATRIEKRG